MSISNGSNPNGTCATEVSKYYESFQFPDKKQNKTPTVSQLPVGVKRANRRVPSDSGIYLVNLKRARFFPATKNASFKRMKRLLGTDRETEVTLRQTCVSWVMRGADRIQSLGVYKSIKIRVMGDLWGREGENSGRYKCSWARRVCIENRPFRD